MNALDELKSILSQKTVRTTRLAPLVKEVENMYIQQGRRIRIQKQELADLRDERFNLQKRLKKKGNEHEKKGN